MSQDTYDLTWTERPKTIGGKKYLLREASGEATVKYRNAAMRSLTIGEDGKTHRIDGAANVEPLLVSLCLYMVKEDGSLGSNVPEATVRGWPGRVVKPLFEEAKAISHLDDNLTVEQLTKQRDDLNRQIENLKKEKETEKN